MKPLRFRYCNYKGETSWRNVVPIEISFKKTDYHDEEQWIMRALDVDRNVEREFAMKDIWEFAK